MSYRQSQQTLNILFSVMMGLETLGFERAMFKNLPEHWCTTRPLEHASTKGTDGGV